jgi:transposase
MELNAVQAARHKTHWSPRRVHSLAVLRVSKMGNRYLRKLLVVGAHAVLYHPRPHEDALRSWAKKLMQTKPFKLVVVTLPIGWDFDSRRQSRRCNG